MSTPTPPPVVNTPDPAVVADVAQRDAIMEPWAAVAAADGWDDLTPDTLYWAAVDGLAWSLLEQTSDVADRAPSAAVVREARETAERMLATAQAAALAQAQDPAQEALAEVTADDRRDVAKWLIEQADQRVKFFSQRRDGIDALMRHLALLAREEGDR